MKVKVMNIIMSMITANLPCLTWMKQKKKKNEKCAHNVHPRFVINICF